VSAVYLVSVALIFLCLVFAGLYVLARHIENYGIVDIAWSYAFGALAIFYAVAGSGWSVRRMVIATLATIWSVRLGTHLAIRVIGHHPVEDSRYQQLRRDWAANFGAKMFGFFQLQAVSVAVLGVAFLIVCLNPAPALHPLEIAGSALWLIALGGEALADAQLAAFKRRTDSRDGVCDAGLWRYSRHPNYFFEWLVWVAYFVFALGSPWGLAAIVGPVSILWLLLRVTGIPMTEEQSLRRRGDAYRRYQQTTSAFVPWFPKKISP
jgi:steroid 5-alpha reductase family enzyme